MKKTASKPRAAKAAKATDAGTAPADAGTAPEPSAPSTPSPPPAKPGLVSVRVLNPGGLGEEGVNHPCGSVFEIEAERAAALGDLVSIVD